MTLLFERYLVVKIKIIMPGRKYITPIAPVMSFLPEVTKLNNSKGMVSIFPPPITKVRIYWLHETKKANKPPITTPGKTVGKVI